MTTKTGIAILASALTLAAAHAQTNVLFNSLGGRPAGSDNIFAVGPIGESFSTPGSSLNLLNVEVGLTDAGSVGSGSTTVSLYSDNPTGPVPGSLLATIGTINDSQLADAFQDFDVTLATPYTLAPDTRYWIVLNSDASSTAEWTYTLSSSGPGVAGEYFNNSSGTSSTSTGPYSMEVSAAAVPEPSSLALLALGAAAVIVHRVRRQSAAR